MAMPLSSGANEPHWVNPRDIQFKISPFLDLPNVKDGDWDIERRHPFQGTAKYRAVVQRYVGGKEWIETDLFTDAYRRRLEKDGRIGRYRNLRDLAESYRCRFDPLFETLKRDGFRTQGANGKRHALPSLLVGRDGEVFIGNQGNHRLAMAQVLGLERIAGRIVCRHQLWNG